MAGPIGHRRKKNKRCEQIAEYVEEIYFTRKAGRNKLSRPNDIPTIVGPQQCPPNVHGPWYYTTSNI